MSDDTAIFTTARVVAAYAAGNRFPAAELPRLLTTVHAAVTQLREPAPMEVPTEEAVDKPTPAQIRKSITPEALISFIDSKPYKTLKRHLATHGLDPVSYRERYGLPRDYPMTAPSYSARRSALARSIGLGRGGQQDVA